MFDRRLRRFEKTFSAEKQFFVWQFGEKFKEFHPKAWKNVSIKSWVCTNRGIIEKSSLEAVSTAENKRESEVSGFLVSWRTPPACGGGEIFEQEFNYTARVWLHFTSWLCFHCFLLIFLDLHKFFFSFVLSCFPSPSCEARGERWIRHRTREMCVHIGGLAYEQFIKRLYNFYHLFFSLSALASNMKERNIIFPFWASSSHSIAR